MSEIARRPVDLAPLSPELNPQVMVWAAELRTQFTALGMSINLFCRLHPIDKGTVSRYLNGKRVPVDRWFLDRIIAMRASSGSQVTDDVRAHLIDLQMAALKVAHPHEYKVRKVSDQLEVAVTSWKEAERYAHTLENELTERSRLFHEIRAESESLRTGWNEDRIRFQREIIDLRQQLELARERARITEMRVLMLEELLDRLETSQHFKDTFGSDGNYEDNGYGQTLTVEWNHGTTRKTRRHLLTQEPLTFGRNPSCTICLDQTDTGLSKQAGSVRLEKGLIWLVSESTTTPLAVVDDLGLRSILTPGRRQLVEGRLRILIEGTRDRYELVLHGPKPQVTGHQTASHPEVQINETDRMALIALFSGYLEDSPRYDPYPKSYAVAAARLGFATHYAR
ncbi:hypothetical protein FDA94_14390 [Herbidospora galbida]|uniref:Uncharacterized protein n=1 Tax=Herbidospora galbida TaxID=2575442 RepID=A0A4U3MG05_9ACTN|nr:FHA domain-containing protein [Herbidospora galbida]TKK88111.1 hypothetical protein FDA94_14390 [Herbidospora galbida]